PVLERLFRICERRSVRAKKALRGRFGHLAGIAPIELGLSGRRRLAGLQTNGFFTLTGGSTAATRLGKSWSPSSSLMALSGTSWRALVLARPAGSRVTGWEP